MHIRLVTPANPPSFWTYDSILPTLGKRCLFPNLSMPTLAGLTPEGHRIELCDENVEELDIDAPADIVGVTGYIAHRPRMLELIGELRRRGRFVVVGGPYASLCPDALRDRCDVLFVGEAEETWPRFLRDFEAGRWQRVYEAVEKPSLEDAPMPRFDLLKADRYHALTVQFARGCPYTCEFCDIIVVYGRRPRVKRVEQMLREIDECRRLGARQVFLVDDNFIGNRNLAKELLRAMAAWGREHDFPIVFQTEVSVNVAQDDELLELLRDANFVTLFIGIESPRVESLEETRKTQNTRGDLVEAVRKVQSYGLQIQGGMIVGFDHDDPAIFEEQLRFIQDARIPVSMTGMLQALPETPLYARMAEEGRLLTEYSGDQFVFSNIVPAQMSRLDLLRGYRWLLSRLYDYDHFRQRTLGFLRNRGRHPGQRTRIGREELGLFGRILRDTLLGGEPGRTAFTLRLLAETLLSRPAAFSEAVAYAIMHKGLSDYMKLLLPHLDHWIELLEGEDTTVPAIRAGDDQIEIGSAAASG